MKKILAIASMLLFVAVSVLGFAFAEEQAAANESIDASQINETLTNATLSNETLGNDTLLNETLGNETLGENDTNPFADAKNRKPSYR